MHSATMDVFGFDLGTVNMPQGEGTYQSVSHLSQGVKRTPFQHRAQHVRPPACSNDDDIVYRKVSKPMTIPCDRIQTKVYSVEVIDQDTPSFLVMQRQESSAPFRKAFPDFPSENHSKHIDGPQTKNAPRKSVQEIVQEKLALKVPFLFSKSTVQTVKPNKKKSNRFTKEILNQRLTLSTDEIIVDNNANSVEYVSSSDSETAKNRRNDNDITLQDDLSYVAAILGSLDEQSSRKIPPKKNDDDDERYYFSDLEVQLKPRKTRRPTRQRKRQRVKNDDEEEFNFSPGFVVENVGLRKTKRRRGTIQK